MQDLYLDAIGSPLTCFGVHSACFWESRVFDICFVAWLLSSGGRASAGPRASGPHLISLPLAAHQFPVLGRLREPSYGRYFVFSSAPPARHSAPSVRSCEMLRVRTFTPTQSG